MCRNFESIALNKMLVRDKLQEFGDIERKVFKLKYFEKLSIRECAEKLGIMMEINTKAFLRKGCFFPDIRHFAFIRAMGVDCIAVERWEDTAYALEGIRGVNLCEKS
jgi:hypothetical protein